MRRSRNSAPSLACLVFVLALLAVVALRPGVLTGIAEAFGQKMSDKIGERVEQNAPTPTPSPTKTPTPSRSAKPTEPQ